MWTRIISAICISRRGHGRSGSRNGFYEPQSNLWLTYAPQGVMEVNQKSKPNGYRKLREEDDDRTPEEKAFQERMQFVAQNFRNLFGQTGGGHSDGRCPRCGAPFGDNGCLECGNRSKEYLANYSNLKRAVMGKRNRERER
jgi:hypothetical protein